MLTDQQKIDIIEYISSWSIKPILEDVDSVGETWTEETSHQLETDIDEFLDQCKAALKNWFIYKPKEEV